jgi:hypothetical protein
MGIVGLLVQAELRRRWRTLLVLGLLVGVVAGAAMWAGAAARRTDSAYQRLLETTNAEDILVNPVDGYADPDVLGNLPQVGAYCRARGAPVILTNAQGEPDFTDPYLTLASDGSCMFDISAPGRVEGRLPDPDEPYEIFVSSAARRSRNLAVGDTIAAFYAPTQDSKPVPIELTVTGTGVFAEDALADLSNETSFPMIVMTPAFADKHPWRSEDSFEGLLVRLRNGEADVASYNAAALEAAGEPILFEDRFENERKGKRALEPFVFALWLFALGVAIAGGIMVAGAVYRTLRDATRDAPLLSALGVSRQLQTITLAILALVVATLGAAVAVAGSVLFSGLAPLGAARPVEPDPGLRADWLVVGSGVLITVVVVAIMLGLVLAWGPDRRDAREMRERLGPLARLRTNLPVPAAAGVRLSAGDLGRARTGARTTLIGAVAGVIAVLVVELVGAGLLRLVDTPDRYGWTWDASVGIGNDDDIDVDAALRGTGDAIASRTAVQLGQVDVGGITVAAVGIGESVGTPVRPPLLRGRHVGSDDEVVLGATTLDRLGATVGDRVPVRSGSSRRDMTVVGEAVFPRMAEYPGAPTTGLGEGVVLTADTFTEMTNVDYFVDWLVDLAPDATTDDLREALTSAGIHPDEVEVMLVDNPQKPDALFGYEDTSTLRHMLAALLGAIAVVSVTLGITSSVRGARRDLAVLRTVGLTKRQVRTAVHTHGAVIAAVALVIGLPLGVAAGRWAWEWFAHRLGVANDPITPTFTIGGLVLLSLASAIVVSVPVARRATRHAPASVLRSE